MNFVGHLQPVDPARIGGKQQASDRVDPSSHVVISSHIDFDPRVDPDAHVDPEMITEIVPMIAGVVIFAAAILANSAYVMLGFEPKQAISVTGIASLAGVMAYGIFRQAKLFDHAEPKGRAFDALAVSGRL